MWFVIFRNAFRSLRKNLPVTATNMIGLTTGITGSLLLFLYVADEFSYDRYHTHAESTYRVITHFKDASGEYTWPGAEMPLAATLRNQYSQVEKAASFRKLSDDFYQYHDKNLRIEKIYAAGSDVFGIFDYQFLQGDPASALTEPNSMVLTESVARKYFSDPALGYRKSLKNHEGVEFTITGIIKDVPLNSHFRFNALAADDNKFAENWLAIGAYTYVVFQEGYQASDFDMELARIVKEKVAPTFDKAGLTIAHELQPVLDIHLYSKIAMEQTASGNIFYLYVFATIGIFLIVIACINYVNLTTGKSIVRQKEIGIRKILGSQRSNLIYQLLLETVILVILSLCISLVLIYLLLPAFNTLAGKEIAFSDIVQPGTLAVLFGLAALVGIIAGIYPAVYATGFNQISVMQGRFSIGSGTTFLRRSLVSVQFAIAVFVLFSTLLVFNQLNFLKTQDLGFDTQKIFRIDLDQQMLRNKSALIEKLKGQPGIVTVSEASSYPGRIPPKQVFTAPDAEGRLADQSFDVINADRDFIMTLGMTILEGTGFTGNNDLDERSVLVNQTLVKRMEWTDPVGKQIVQKLNGSLGDVTYTVAGVVKDFNQRALYTQIEPLIVKYGTDNPYLFVRYNGDVKKVLSFSNESFKLIYPGNEFVYNFIDQDFNSQYKNDDRRGRLFAVFAILSFSISCLGLVGFTVFILSRRVKEISIRKVNGATVAGLMFLLSREFYRLVLIGVLLAGPAAYYFASSWLQNFAYKVALEAQWTAFVVAAVLSFLIMSLTIAIHVYRAANLNPVRVLKSE